MLIQEREIRRVVKDEKEYRYGRFMDIRDVLERMTISFDEGNRCYRMNARMSIRDEKFIVSMKISQDGEIIQSHCSCSLKGQCRHIAAILFFLKTLTVTSFPYFYEKDDQWNKQQQLAKIEKQRQERILQKKQQESMDLIHLYKEQLLRESFVPLISKQYQIKVFVKQKKDHLWIAFKILAPHQSYIIKNIESFLKAIDHHENVQYSKNFGFIHSLEAFDEDSREIITLMKKCFLNNQYLQQGIIKTLMLNDELDEFYQIMSVLPSSYCDIAFDKKNIQIPLEITLKEESYVLDFSDYHQFENVLMTSHYIYRLENDVLYRYDFHAPQQVLTFIQKWMETKGGFYIPQSSLMDFYKYVLYDLNDDILLDTHLFDTYHQEDMINLYADMTKDDQICIQLEYIYDDHMSYGFDEHNTHKSKQADLIEDYLRPYIEDIDDHMVYLQYDHDFTYQFLKESLPYLSHYCQVFVSDALNSFSQAKPVDIRVGVHLQNGLLSIDIQSVHVQKEELMDILKAYKKKRKFYKLKNGQILSLDNQELQDLDHLTDTLSLPVQDIVRGEVQIPTYRLFEINQMMQDDTSLHYQRSEELKKWIEDFQTKEHEFDVPEHYQAILRDYQKKGYQWLRLMEHYHFGGILADDMGLGKTLQMITYFDSLKGQGTHLVIAPASLILNWQDELMKFSNDLNVLCVYGNKEEREEHLKNQEQYDVLITSYDYLRRDIEWYEKLSFHTVVIDEAQNIKNPKTRNAICVKRLKAKQRFALTGTPIENSLAELWSIFDFLMPYYLYHYSYFLEQFERPIVKEHNEQKQERLKQMITPFVLRRNKKDVLYELPEKIEQTLYMHLSEEEEKLYLANLVQVNQSLQQKLDVQKLGHIDILAMLTRLRQLCQDSRLLYPEFQGPSSKLKGCMELIHSLKDNHKKILLFSSFTSLLHLIEEQCQKEHVSYYLLDGSTPKEKRKKMVDQFQNDDTTLFLISLKAGGSGLNLTSAQAVIHYDPWWNMSAKNQATDRAHRIGQQETVQVFSLIMKNTIEEKIMELQMQKKNLADTFVEGNEGSITSMSLEDMKSLFEIS